MSKKVYIDCTFTYKSGLNTGIQRVVRNILARHSTAKTDYDLEFIPVVSILDRYYQIPLESILKPSATFEGLGQKGKNFFSQIRSDLKSYVSEENLAVKLLGGIETLSRKLFALVKFVRLSIVGFKMRQQRVYFEKGSQFILLDAFWTYDITHSFKRSNQGVEKVTAVIYDLIPLLYPQFVEKANCFHFAKAFPHLLELADQFVCISQVVAQDLEKYMAENSTHRKPVFSFRLGSDFNIKNSLEQKPPTPAMLSVFDGGPVWITVGTIEPRKNHDFILDAFETLWTKGNDQRLLIVGRIGWMCDDLMTRINNHPELNKKLYFFQSVSDAELVYCYKNSKGLVFASHVEGFGLPIVEAMRMKLTVLCSDIPVFREVGGSYPTYFSLKNPQTLADALLKSQPKAGSPPAWPNWDQSFKEFFEKIF